MDKRTRLAVLLIALILGANLAYTAYQQKKHAEVQRARAVLAADSVAAALQAAPPAMIPPPRREPEPRAEAAPDTTPVAGTGALFPPAAGAAGGWTVETPLQRIRIASAGALVQEISLHGFDVYGDGPVNLIPPPTDPSRVALGLRIQTRDGWTSLDGARFEAEGGNAGSGGVLQVTAEGGAQTLALRCEATGGGAVVKRFTFDPARYDFTLEIVIEPGPEWPRADAYSLAWTTGMPFTESNPKEDEPRLRAVVALDQEQIRKRALDFKRPEPVRTTGSVHWTCVQSKYFTVAIIPATPVAGTAEIEGDAKTRWIGTTVTKPIAGRATDSYRVYAGPIDLDEIRGLGAGLESTVELGWKWIRPISSALVHLIEFLHRFIPNYGLVIIVVSVLAKLVFWPLTEKSFKSMKRMQELQPRIEEIRRRYKDDPKGMNEQVMLMYREQKVNPVGGCVPMLVQMPMFFALFSALQSSIQLRNAPFVGWIDNLAGPDALFRLPTSLPLVGDQFSVLPLLMGGSMIWQAHLTPTPGPSSGPAAGMMASQQTLMKWFMPIIMTVFFYKMPSGLVIYWIVTTLMSIWQQAHINKKLAPAPATVKV